LLFSDNICKKSINLFKEHLKEPHTTLSKGLKKLIFLRFELLIAKDNHQNQQEQKKFSSQQRKRKTLNPLKEL
jgi:hypothetical protein